jgi:hypothetical protein
MYSDITLTNHLQTSSTVSTKSKVIAEWNLNNSETIEAIGNYKNRPTSGSPSNTAPNTTWNANENEATKGTNQWYGYTDYDVTIDGGYTDEVGTPVTFSSSRERQKSLMSLEDCFNRFRPRSGINKLRFFGKNKKIIPVTSNNDTFINPRYYAASKDDKFKYWSSYRTTIEKINNIDTTVEYGISGVVSGNDKLIQDAAPFVVYKNLVPTNKVVLKVQTNVSNNNSLPTANADPFYSGSTPNYKSTPKIWKIQKYTGTQWTDMYDSVSVSYPNGQDVFTEDGYFQLSYGITNAQIISGTYKNTFVIIGSLSSTAALPLIQEPKRIGQTYLVKSSTTDKGTLYIYNGQVSDTTLTNYEAIVPTYGWYKSEESITNSQLFVTELDKTIAPSFVESSVTVYREFEYIKGLRILVTSMLNTNTVFDLIELSPRLDVDITDNVSSFSVKKFASDLGVSNLPVGQLLASTGDIAIFDNNQVFNKNNLNSLLNISSTVTLISKSLQMKFYEVVLNVPQEFGILSNTPQPTGTTNISIKTESNHGIVQGDTVIISGVTPSGYNGTWTAQALTTGSTLVVNIGSNPGNITTVGTAIKSNPTYRDFYIPVKTMYSDGFPQYSDATRDVSMSLRDLTFYFESFLAPEILLRNASVSFIVATLLDSIGFSNYKFLRASKADAVIPYFMVSPDKNIMQILQDLAVATQTTMFFDEANNFVVMSKEYLVPQSNSVRNKDINLYGIDSGPRRSNIIEINSESNDIYNDGKIVYYNRYIQKQPNDLQSLSRLDKNQVFEYQRSVLWSLEASEQNLQSRNEEDVTQTAYPLTAIPLAKTLSKEPPTVINFAQGTRITNNIIRFGDGAYWMGRYAGYFYSNGEIIKYDAIEFSYGSADSTNTVWITSNEEYQYYFSKINKGDKMYKTGNVRIYAEPFYESYNPSTNQVDANAALNTATRMKFGPVSKHGRGQFGTTITEHTVDDGTTDSWWEKAKNVIATNPQKLFKGKDNIATITANKKNIEDKKFTTKTTIKNFLGKQTYNLRTTTMVPSESIQSSGLELVGPKDAKSEIEMGTISYAKKYLKGEIDYDTYGARLRFFGEPTENKDWVSLGSSYPAYQLSDSKISGKSGGIAILTNTAGEGYYYELVALDYTKAEALKTSSTINTLFFYKLKKDDEGILVPTILHEEFRNILVDTGKFTAKVLKTQTQGTDSVYDIGVSVSKTSGSSWVFSLYLDNEKIATVLDNQPITSGVEEAISLFVRGSSQAFFENTYAMRRFLTKNEMSIFFNSNLTEEEKEKRTKSFANSVNIFDDTKVSGISGSKYILSPLVQTGFLSKLSTSSIPESQISYEEFGSIMRECAYFNVKFDKAYPALTSLIAPIPASLGGYVIVGYNSTPYRAEFLLFNVTDFVLDLGANKNYLDNVSITGIAFTQEAARDLTVDEFLTEKSNYTSSYVGPAKYTSVEYKNNYTDIKNNRLLYGSKSFVIDSPYIQTADLAQNLMNFIINRISKPRKVVAVKVFGMPIIQLGDIVSFVYDTTKTLPNTVSGNNFVVYASEYQREQTGPSTILYLSEVL